MGDARVNPRGPILALHGGGGRGSPHSQPLRVVLGLAILSLTFVGPQTLWGLVGLVPVATGLLGSCPLYTVLGVSTCARE